VLIMSAGLLRPSCADREPSLHSYLWVSPLQARSACMQDICFE
jgi:hypothetical protein